ncbi:hypothetical protein WBP06_08685 [Novosphingobium sp. BL-8H]|uniref:hypothetical protein n=1 Tax=Novosphingobium sp. BL-8H TaxID=3127640 RepID=UPI0037569F8B
MSSGRDFDFGDLIYEASRIVVENWRLLLLLLVTIAAAYTVMDKISGRANLGVGTVVSVYAQYLFLEKVFGVGERGRRRYRSMFGSNFLSGLAIVGGLVLLGFPGVYLAARWSAASSLVVVDEHSATASLSASWRATRGRWLPMFWAYTVTGVLWLALLVATALIGASIGAGKTLWWTGVILQLSSTMFILTNWVIGAAAYRIVGGSSDSLEVVFA